ncbi:PAS domain-containing protein [Actinomycetospora lutea]|uniref:PAS domain-containing protein n=1 Tax=Actinomycetospora lutea TaxID=663604 RepID=UPI00236654E7|nr:PAS domain-containing protein [Actinomycetospora lutea]MDD7940165.1 PAS domain-containing protein [Actinomycetospora lutea]
MITNNDLAVVPDGAARAVLDAARVEECEEVARRLSTGSLDRIRRVVLRLLARASVSDADTRAALRAEADELDAAVRAARDIIFSSPGPAPPTTRGEPAVETALLDATGTIVWVDAAWDAFCTVNGGDTARSGVGRSYLALCDAAAPTDGHSAAVAAAIRAALDGDLPAPTRVEVPCHAPTQTRFFDVLISSRRDDRGRVLGATVTLSQVVSARV